MNKATRIIALGVICALFVYGTNRSIFDMEDGAPQGRYAYRYTGEVKTGTDVIPLIGQLTKDGKSMYLTSQNIKGEKHLYKMSRTEVGDNFDDAVKLSGEVNDAKYGGLMPTASADENTLIYVSSTNGKQSGNDLFISTRDKNGEYSNTRALDELNDINVSDSYPWISANGLRVYFTKQKGTDITFFVAERTSLNDQFSTPREMGLRLPKINNNMSCILTSNELEVYALSGNAIYHGSRKSVKQDFGVVEEIANTENNGYLNGLTLTDDGKELFVYNSIGYGNTQIIRFVNTGNEMPHKVTSAGK